MTNKKVNKFHIEQTPEYITLYINGGLARRILKEKCSSEQQLQIVMEWLNEFNWQSSFVYGKFGTDDDDE